MSRRLNWKLHWTEGLLPSHLWLPFQLFCTSHSLSFSQWDVQKPDLTSMSTLGRRASHRQRSPRGSRVGNTAAGKQEQCPSFPDCQAALVNRLGRAKVCSRRTRKTDRQQTTVQVLDRHTGSRPPVMPSPGHSCDISKPSLRCGLVA